MRRAKLQDSATNSGGAVPIVRKGEVRARVVDYLLKIAPEEVMPKTIARALRIPHNTAKSECMRILAEFDSPIVRTRRGWYRHKISIDTIQGMPGQKRIGFHGIKLEARCNQDNTGYCLTGTYRTYRRRRTWEKCFEGRWVTIVVHERGLVEVWVKASEQCFDYLTFARYQAWVKGLVEFVPESSWFVIQLGVNVDVVGLQLDGLKSVKLSSFLNGWFQIYQKGEDAVRFECHTVPKLTVPELLDMIKRIAEPPSRNSYHPTEPDPDDYSVW